MYKLAHSYKINQMLKLFLLLCITTCGRDTLSPACPTTCYPNLNPSRNIKGGVGECTLGKPLCDEDGKQIKCLGFKLPENEVCNGKDDDCDGEVDDYPTDKAEAGCKLYGVCAQRNQVCTLGVWFCGYPESYQETESACDGVDNDCDGIIDEYFDEHPDYCYSGPLGTELVAPCHPGALRCISGDVECVNEVLPKTEICNGYDDDCDGLVDNVAFDSTGLIDIVLGIDTSGSMGAEIAAVVSALSQFANAHNDSRFAFAILDMAAWDLYPNWLIQDFESASFTATTLSMVGSTGNSLEPTIDATYGVCLPTNPFALSWRPTSKHIFFGFADELPQRISYSIITMPDVAMECSLLGVQVFYWTPYGTSEYADVCAATGGQHFPLTSSADEMLANLNTIIEALCGF